MRAAAIVTRTEKFGFADVVVIEKIRGARFESVDIESPAAQRNRQAELVLFVALAVQRNEADILAARANSSSGPAMDASGGA